MTANKIKNLPTILNISNIKKNILPNFNIDSCEIIPIKFKDTNKQRSVYKVTFKDRTYCLKKMYCTEENLLIIYSSIQWLSRAGFHVPKLIPTKDRSRYVNYHGMLFILTNWFVGTRWDYDNKEHILLAIKNLALMHKDGVNFYPINKLNYNFEVAHNSNYKHFLSLLKYNNMANETHDSFSNIFLNNFASIEALGKLSCEASSSINNNFLIKSICHNDYVNKNIIVGNKGQIMVIDFDNCDFDIRVKDLCSCLKRILRRDTENWNFQFFLLILENYENIFPLNFDEWKYILSHLSFPNKHLKLARDYYNNTNKRLKTNFITILEKLNLKNQAQLIFSHSLKKYINKRFMSSEGK